MLVRPITNNCLIRNVTQRKLNQMKWEGESYMTLENPKKEKKLHTWCIIKKKLFTHKKKTNKLNK